MENIDHRIREIETRLIDLEQVYRNIVIELGGVPSDLGRDPSRPSIRNRLHVLETENHTAAITKSALDAARTLHISAMEKKFSKKEKVWALIIATALVLSTWMQPIIFPHS